MYMIEGWRQSCGVHHNCESEEIVLLSFRLKAGHLTLTQVLKEPKGIHWVSIIEQKGALKSKNIITAKLPLPVASNRVSVTWTSAQCNSVLLNKT